MKKKNQLPILIIIPHGGWRVPEELSGNEAVSRFDLFIQSDTCANDLFNFGDRVAGTIDTDVSRLFIDLDRPYTALPPNKNGVIKKMTLYGKPIFREDLFPDEIAISNMLQRYWFPFHDAVKKIVSSGGIRLILECHTMMAVGPEISRDPGKPRPIVMLEHITETRGAPVKTCDSGLVTGMMEQMKKALSGEENTIAEKFVVSDQPSGGFILGNYGTSAIPMIRLGISRALFLNDTYFSYEYLRVDELRIRRLGSLLWAAIEKFFYKTIALNK